MRGLAGRFPLPVALFAAAGILILAGASFDVQGHTGKTGLEVMAGGLLAVLAGIFHGRWRLAVICALAAVVAVIGALPIEQIRTGNFHAAASQYALMNLLGVAALALGGVLGARGYDLVTTELRSRVTDLQQLNRKLAEQHRIFLAATEEPSFSETDAEKRAEATAHALGAGFCVYYLATTDGRQFAPDGLGCGFAHVRPGPVQRGRKDGLVGAIDSNQEFHTVDRRDLSALFRYFPPDFRIENALAVPIRVGDKVEGFILAGDKPNGFSEDDRRLARTLATRAGISFASVHAVALSQHEAGRYALLNELVSEASGLTVDDALNLVLDRGRELIAYDSARVAVFGRDGTFTLSGSLGSPAPVAGSPLDQVAREGRTVVRRVLAQQGLYSGLKVNEGAQVSEALVPVRGKGELFGILCLGRKAAAGFAEDEIPTLEELSAIVGLAVENSRILQTVVGQATRLDSALDVLGEVSRALTTTTEGRSKLEERAAKAAMRVTGTDHVLLTRTARDGTAQRINYGEGFPESLAGSKVPAGQGLIGAVMLSAAPLALEDATDSLEMSNPPDLIAAGLRGALCVPMLDDGSVRGTISVYSAGRREWSEEEIRSVSTLANATLVALKNAELYSDSRNMIWELTNLHEGLRAVTSTLELNEVLDLVLGWAARASEAQIGCLALKEDGVLHLVGSYGTDRETAGRLALGLGAQICLDVMSSNEAQLEQMDQPGRTGNPLEPRAVLCVPITLREDPIGVVFLANYMPERHFNEDHRRLVSALAAQAGVAIDNARLFRDREDLFLGTLHAMAAAVDARDPYTAGHSQRVTQYALAIARRLDYAPDDPEAWKRLEQGGLLHDIGKIGVPDSILQKPAQLTKDEFDVMKHHPVEGFEILKGVKLLKDELVIVRSHHERFDGHGYPDGLKGDQLPMCAWIVAAADALDAMTSDRPYRKGMDLAVALSEIKRGSGTHFHPEVARALLDAVAEGELQLIAAPSLYEGAPVAGVIENR